MEPVVLAKLQGWFNVANGLWPLVHMPSFEAVFGPKTDKWLVRTVAGLMVSNGVALVTAGRETGGIRQARRIGTGTAVTLAAIDVVYAGRGIISRMYLVDAAVELLWVFLWRKRRHTASA